MLLASDGLWDVMTNQDAVDLTNRCIKRAKEKGASRNAAVRIAASVLTKAAIDRGSKDNVTVVIVSLLNSRTASTVEGASATSNPQQARACGDCTAQQPGGGTMCKAGDGGGPPTATA